LTRRDQVLHLLAEHPEGLTDTQLATLTGASHQTINQTCRRLAAEGFLHRDDAFAPIVNRSNGTTPSPRPAPTISTPYHEEWFWEGNVQTALVHHLGELGASIRSEADTATRAHGTDVIAVLDGRTLHIEVKGWPSKSYADASRAHERKPTAPTSQAKHNMSDAISTALRLRSKHRIDRVIIVVPDFPRYRNLAAEALGTLARVDIEIWFVDETGEVSAAQ
jgi:hypothetical protein